MKRLLLSTVILLSMFFTGCISDNNEAAVDDFNNSLSLKKDGRIIETIFEDFEKEYYSLESLLEMVSEDISDFDIKLIHNNYNEEEKKVSVTLEYLDYEVFNEYNEKEFFYGTVEEAYEKGLLKNRLLVEQKSLEFVSVTEANIEKLSKYHIIVMDENVDLYLPSKALYLDDSATLSEKNKVGFTDSTQNHIIIFK